METIGGWIKGKFQEVACNTKDGVGVCPFSIQFSMKASGIDQTIYLKIEVKKLPPAAASDARGWGQVKGS